MEEQWLTTTDTIKWLQERGISRSRLTIIAWCKKHNIGRKVGGSWMVSIDKLRRLLQGENNGQESTGGGEGSQSSEETSQDQN